MQKSRARTCQSGMERLGALQKAEMGGFSKPAVRVFWCPGIPVTKCHRQGGFKRQKHILSRPCGRKSEIKAREGLLAPRSVGRALCCPHVCAVLPCLSPALVVAGAPWWSSACSCVTPASASVITCPPCVSLSLHLIRAPVILDEVPPSWPLLISLHQPKPDFQIKPRS